MPQAYSIMQAITSLCHNLYGLCHNFYATLLQSLITYLTLNHQYLEENEPLSLIFEHSVLYNFLQYRVQSVLWKILDQLPNEKPKGKSGNSNKVKYTNTGTVPKWKEFREKPCIVNKYLYWYILSNHIEIAVQKRIEHKEWHSFELLLL